MIIEPQSDNTLHASEDTRSEVTELRAEIARVHAEREALEAGPESDGVEIATLLDKEIGLLRNILDARVALARLEDTVSWRLLEIVRAKKATLRRLAMMYTGRRIARRRRPPIPAFVRDAPIGVNLAGYLTTESGMGEAARLSARSLEAAGIPLTLNNVASRLRMDDRTFTAFSDVNPHPFNLIHLNADNMEWFSQARGDRYFRNRYTIGYWFWELPEFRSDWMSAFSVVDEVWVPTTFNRTALEARSPVPVTCMPLPLLPPTRPSCDRSHFGLGDDRFMFLYTFDVSSQMERKNPIGLIEAFRGAFGRRRDVVLVLKFTNTEYDPAGIRRMRRLCEGINAVLLEGYMARDELQGLMAAADCYVSLHRSEGFGLGIAEAMALGKPIIATRYSGPADLMTPENSFCVDYRVVPIERDRGPYLKGMSWAEPDLEHASLLMREAVENPSVAQARGRRAAADIAEWRTPALTGDRARRRLEEIKLGHRHDSAL